MRYLDVEEIYNYFKNNINLRTLFYSNKIGIIKVIYSGFILAAALLGGSFVLLAMNFSKLAVISIIVGILMLISCMISAIIIDKKIYSIIKEKYKFGDLGKNIYYHFVIKKEFIEYLHSKEIKTKKQKESLVKLLSQKSQKYKRDKLWLPSIIAALYIPIWNNLISKMMSLDSKNIIQSVFINISLFAGISLVIIFAVCFVKYTINDSILMIFNTKSTRYEMMAYMLQEDLILNYYNKDEKVFNGELTIIKK